MLSGSFVSNTLQASGNQSWFLSDGTVTTGRAFFRLFAGGSFAYRLTYENAVDSTFADGSHSRADYICKPWEMLSLRCGVVSDPRGTVSWCPLTVGGSTSYAVRAGEVFHTDPVTLSAEDGDYLCVELTFRGSEMPYSPESLLLQERHTADGFVPDNLFPLPAMIACNRPVKKQIAFLGDSITMGIGTAPGSDEAWPAQIAHLSGKEFAWMNLGLGYGRASDAAGDGYWLQKAKQADFVSVCFGVNDILQTGGDNLYSDLERIVTLLRQSGCGVGLFTVPPFDLTNEQEQQRREVNRRLRGELSRKVEYVFDLDPVLGLPAPEEHRARYGGHPDAEGCRVLAEAFIRQYGEIR